MGSCESLAKSPNLSFLPLKFPFEIRFTDRPVSRINQLPIDISFPLPPSPYTQSGITFLFRTPPLLNHPAGCIVQKDYDKFDKYEILLFISRLLVDLEKKNTSAIFQGDRPSIFIHGGRFPREKEISRERVRSIIGWRTIWFESKANSNGPGNNLMNNLVTRQLLSRFFPRCSSPRLSIVKPVHVGEAGLWGRSKREAFDQKSAE